MKILVIRFSSFGDIVQSLGCLGPLKEKFPDCEITFLTKRAFTDLVKHCPYVDNFICLEDNKGLFSLSFQILKSKFNYIYDAHANLRTRIISIILAFQFYKFIKRPKQRIKRFLFFVFRINTYKNWPFKGMLSYLTPLSFLGVKQSGDLHQIWNFSDSISSKVSNLIDGDLNSYIALAPSAAWEMKRWPLSHFSELIRLHSNSKFIILGGPSDGFCQELEDEFKGRVINLAGKLSLIESCFVVSKVKKLVTADTGLLHVADLLNTQAVALIGPTAFGYPTNQNVTVLDKKLSCAPCSKDGRGKCHNEVYQRCMVDISPSEVLK